MSEPGRRTPAPKLSVVSGARQRRGALDGPAARVAALGVAVLVGGLLAWIHRDDLFPPEAMTPTADDPVALCLAPRVADIDKMLAEGTIDETQAALFKSRAEALCQAQAGRGSGPPAPPGN